MSRRIGCYFAALLVPWIAQAGTLSKIWDFDADAQQVYALSYSPDGKSIAALLGDSLQDQFVVLLDVADPRANKRRLEIKPSELGPYIRQPIWSPSGQQLILNTTKVRLTDGKTCSLPDPLALFLSEGLLITTENKPVPSEIPTDAPTAHLLLSFFGSECQKVGSWDDPRTDLSVIDTSAERGVLLERHGRGRLVVDAISKVIRWELPSLSWRGIFRFADSGNAICAVVGIPWEESATCLEIGTGRELAKTKQFTYLQLTPALHARRVVLSDTSKVFDFVDFVWVQGSLKRRVVWDFATNKELASWKPKSQKVITLDRPSGASQPYPFDISPDGEYIVEGGSGTISLYRIVP